jgi:gamma-glutamyltranspeptidase/glutathione hydrolase
MVATSHPLATATAIEVLKAGGNAMDAAVAACAVQCVVEPQSTGIGGDCFVLFSPAGGAEIIAFNGSGRAPAAAEAAWYRERGIASIARQSPHAVTVPGAVDAWARLLEDHGRRALGALLQPAIRYAREGYPLHARVRFDWCRAAPLLAGDATAARIFLPEGAVPPLGALHRQPELAATLERIAEVGPAGFYEGPVAEDMVAYLNRLGGLHSLEDFAATRGDYVSPIETRYRDHQVTECPPNGQGIVALLMLNILSGLESGTDPLAPRRLHLEIEAARLAYRDRDDLIGDPDHAPVPVERLLSPAHAAARRALIDETRAMAMPPPRAFPAHEDTVYLCVVDRDRNAVSMINSVFGSFGTGLVAPMSGVVLHNRGMSFSTDPAHPNAIAPRKRPLHTIIPGMLVKDGRVAMPFGVMGGHYQAVGHSHFLSNLLDFGLDLQEAIDLARVFPVPGGPVELESGIPRGCAEALAALGHRVATAERPVGGGQAIAIDWRSGVLTGASDPRKDGCALGY